ncbi:MAG: nucleoside deaminase [Anaerolineales bacterium]
MLKKDSEYMRTAIEVAWKSRKNGNHPFGAILVSQAGEILLSAENTVVTEKDVTGHAELNLVRAASQVFDTDILATCSIYTSTEPCPMCAGAIYWGNVRRIVYGLSQTRFYKLVGDNNEEEIDLPCRSVFTKGRKIIKVIGPLIEEEASQVHKDFWS